MIMNNNNSKILEEQQQEQLKLCNEPINCWI